MRNLLPEVHFLAAICVQWFRPAPLRSRSRPLFRGGPIRWLILGGMLLIAAIAIGATVMAGNFRERALRNSERELENTVLLLARHFDQQLEDFAGRAEGPDRVHAIQRHRHAGELQAPDVEPGNPPDAQVQDRRAVLCRRHQRLRRRRQADQRLGGLAGARRSTSRTAPTSRPSSPDPQSPDDAGRAGLQPHHRRLDHGDRPQGHRAERRIPRRHRPRHRARQFRKILRLRRARTRRRRSRCTTATARCSPAIRMSTR